MQLGRTVATQRLPDPGRPTWSCLGTGQSPCVSRAVASDFVRLPWLVQAEMGSKCKIRNPLDLTDLVKKKQSSLIVFILVAA